MAKRQRAMIFFGDETGIRSDHQAGAPWATKGKTRIVTSTGVRFGLNLISAVSAQGEFRFTVAKGRGKATPFIDFLKRLLQGVPQRVILIVDGHPAPKAKMVSLFIGTVTCRFPLFFLPAYSLELNPDDRVRSYYHGETTKYAA